MTTIATSRARAGCLPEDQMGSSDAGSMFQTVFLNRRRGRAQAATVSGTAPAVLGTAAIYAARRAGVQAQLATIAKGCQTGGRLTREQIFAARALAALQPDDNSAIDDEELQSGAPRAFTG